MDYIYYSEQTENKAYRDNYFDVSKVGTLDVLGATFRETMYYNPLNAVNRLAEQYTGEGLQGKVLSKEEYENSEFFREGIQVGDEGIKEGLANLFALRHDKRQSFRINLNRSRGGFALGAAQFGVALGASVLDPLNVASAFVPIVGATRAATLASKFGKTGGRFVTGVIDGAVGATALEPLVLGAAVAEQDKDYGLMDSFLNVTIGAALGGALHVGFGKMSDRINRTPPSTQTKAQVTAISQVANDQHVNVEPIISDAKDTTVSNKPDDNTITVYNSEGVPKTVKIVDKDNDGNINVLDDNVEKSLDNSDVFSKSPYDDDFQLTGQMTFEGSKILSEDTDLSFTVKELLEIGRTKKEKFKLLNDQKEMVEDFIEIRTKQLEEQKLGKKNKKGLFDIFKGKEKSIENSSTFVELQRLKLEKKAIDIQLDKLNGKKVQRPKDPITKQEKQEGEVDSNTKNEKVQTQEGKRLTAQQQQDIGNSKAIEEENIGKLDEFKEEADNILNDTEQVALFREQELEQENDILESDVFDEDSLAELEPELKKELDKERKLINQSTQDGQRAKDSYETVVSKGVTCVIRSKA